MSAPHGGICDTRTDGVDSDPVRTHFASERLDEADNRRLRRGIGGKFLCTIVRNARGDANDSPAFLLSHGRDKSPRTKKVAAQIDVDGAVPKFFAHADDRRFKIHPGVVDKNVYPSKTVERGIRQPFHGRLVGYVHLHGNGLATQCEKFVDNVSSLVGLEIGYHDLGSLVPQTQSNDAADPLRTTRYDSNFSFQSHGVTSPPFT